MDIIDVGAVGSKIYSITAIPAIRERLGSTVSETDSYFPHVSKMITLTWGQKEFKDTVNNLTFSQREKREGFPPTVLGEIVAVITLHDELFPHLVPVVNMFSGQMHQ